MTENNDDLIAERDKLQAAVARLRVERETGVPAELLDKGNTARNREACRRPFGLEGRRPSTQRPPATPAAPASGVGQMSRATLAQLPPGYQLEAWRTGRLEASAHETASQAGRSPLMPGVVPDGGVADPLHQPRRRMAETATFRGCNATCWLARRRCRPTTGGCRDA